MVSFGCRFVFDVFRSHHRDINQMPQQDMSSRIGKSTSPSIQRVITNNTNVQQPVAVPSITKTSFNKQPVKV